MVLAYAAYLPTAQCFALLPLVAGFCRTGSSSGAVLDYDMDRQAVTVVTQRSYRWERRGQLGGLAGLGGLMGMLLGCEACLHAPGSAGLRNNQREMAVQAWLLATQAIDRGACCPGLLCCPAARGRKSRCTTAAPTASCCWPPAPWRPATLQASTQLVHALVAGRFCCNPARQMTSYGTCPSSFGICPAVSQAHAPPPCLSHTLFLCWSTAAADCLFMETGLVAADRLYTTQREILEQLGLGAPPTPGWRVA